MALYHKTWFVSDRRWWQFAINWRFKIGRHAMCGLRMWSLGPFSLALVDLDLPHSFYGLPTGRGIL